VPEENHLDTRSPDTIAQPSKPKEEEIVTIEEGLGELGRGRRDGVKLHVFTLCTISMFIDEGVCPRRRRFHDVKPSYVSPQGLL